MSYGDGNLHDRVWQLEDDLGRAEGMCESLADENVELHEQVDGLERDNAQLRADCDRYRERWAKRGAFIAEQREQVDRLKALNGELCAEVNAKGRRIAELESLVRDMYESMNTISETWAEDEYADRMAALGLLEGGE